MSVTARGELLAAPGSEDIWRAGISREYQGAMKVGRSCWKAFRTRETEVPGSFRTAFHCDPNGNELSGNLSLAGLEA